MLNGSRRLVFVPPLATGKSYLRKKPVDPLMVRPSEVNSPLPTCHNGEYCWTSCSNFWAGPNPWAVSWPSLVVLCRQAFWILRETNGIEFPRFWRFQGVGHAIMSVTNSGNHSKSVKAHSCGRPRHYYLVTILPDRKMQHRQPILSFSFECNFQRSLEIRNDIVDILNANRHANQIGRHTRRKLLLRCKLGVSRRGRMDHESLGVAHIGQLTGKLQVINGLWSSLHITLDTKGKDASKNTRSKKFLG